MTFAKMRAFRLFLLVFMVAGGLAVAAGLAYSFAPPDALAAARAEGTALNSLWGNLPQMKNYTDPQSPPATGEFAATPAEFPGELIVVTYNLRYGEEIDALIDAFRTVEPLPEAGIILLQEMDAAGVDKVARELGYNYVYYPASVAADGDDFGNAILARWPISEPAKLILPGLHPITGQGRTATRATVTIDGMEVLVYSTHIEVATAPPSFREAQFAALLADIPDDAAHVIVGGDFNTVTGRGVGALAERYAAGGLAHNTADLGPTYTRFGLRPSAADHIFSRGFEHLDAGVLGDVTASDHFPVWVRLGLPSE